MAQSCGGSCLPRIVLGAIILLLAVLSVYNARQIAALKKEVARLRTEVSALKAGKRSASPPKVLESIRIHIERARDFAVKGNYRAARNEIEKSLNELKESARLPDTPPTSLLEDIRKKWDETSKALEKALGKSEQRLNKGG